MGACWSCYRIGLGGFGVDGPAVRAVGSMGDYNQARDGAGTGGDCEWVAGKPDWAGRTASC